jgi:hypothetical protein
MPRTVRNFWIEVTIDGKTSKFAGGPQSKDGGFTLIVKQRNSGEVTEALHVEGRVLADGSLQTEARLDAEYWTPGDGALIASSER